jgi:hypothetical protein
MYVTCSIILHSIHIAGIMHLFTFDRRAYSHRSNSLDTLRDWSRAIFEPDMKQMT